MDDEVVERVKDLIMLEICTCPNTLSGYRTMWHVLRLRHKIHIPRRLVESLMRDVSAGTNLHYITMRTFCEVNAHASSVPRASTSLISDSTNLQFEYYIFELIGQVVLVDGHTRSTKASCLLSFSKLSRA